MKTITKITLCILLATTIGCVRKDKKQEGTSKGWATESPTTNEEDNEEDDMVWVCTGPKSKRYHCDEDCKGLSKCSRLVDCISIDSAESIGKTPCRICY